MRAVLTNFGTSGEVEPLLALAVELNQHGHEAVLALSPYYAARVAQLGLEFIAIGPDLQHVQNEINIAMATIDDTTALMDRMRVLCLPIAAALPQMFYELRDACYNADVLISGSSQPAARMVHDITGIPFVLVYTIYVGLQGMVVLPSQQASATFVNHVRSEIGLPPLRNPLTVVGGPAHDGNSPQLNLYAISPHVVSPLPDWPAHHHMTGYFFLNGDEWQADPRLVEFLAAGEPPVVIGFGSMMHPDPKALTDLLLEAVAITGCRAIIQQGWSGLGKHQVPPEVLPVDFVPHHWLFPQAACVVHHGATGTTAATLRAGVPSVFVPHAYEHPRNAQRAEELGIAGPAIPYAELTAHRLGAAIAKTLHTPRYKAAAAAISTTIRSENGVQTARHLIEALVEAS